MAVEGVSLSIPGLNKDSTTNVGDGLVSDFSVMPLGLNQEDNVLVGGNSISYGLDGIYGSYNTQLKKIQSSRIWSLVNYLIGM